MERKPKRREPRIQSLNLVSVEQFNEEGFGAAQSLGRTLNISRNGVELELPQAVPLRSTLSLCLVLGPHTTVDVLGTVRHTSVMDDEHFRVGVEFVALDAAARRAVDDYLLSSVTGTPASLPPVRGTARKPAKKGAQAPAPKPAKLAPKPGKKPHKAATPSTKKAKKKAAKKPATPAKKNRR